MIPLKKNHKINQENNMSIIHGDIAIHYVKNTFPMYILFISDTKAQLRHALNCIFWYLIMVQTIKILDAAELYVARCMSIHTRKCSNNFLNVNCKFLAIRLILQFQKP